MVSLSARRAWIETLIDEIQLEFNSVALRKESVDRNSRSLADHRKPRCVALRKESVDRNFIDFNLFRCRFLSLSARRAWIET